MSVTIRHGDCRDVLRTLPDASVHCCVTSPPYFGLRDYGVAGQIGLEQTPEAFVAELVDVFREVRRVLRDDGTLWLNLGDSYAGSWGARGRGPDTNAPRPDLEAKYGTAAPARKVFRPGNPDKNNGNSNRDGIGPVVGAKAKDLIGIPWMVAFALRADGWYLRQDIIWSKSNPMPESVTDRCTKAHEYIFLMSKSQRYFYDAESILEPFTSEPKTPGGYAPEKATGPQYRGGHSPWEKNRTKEQSQPNPLGRNKRSVWEIATQPFSEAHFATFPPALIEPCIKAGCPEGGTVLDPFGGAGTTGLVADRLKRNAILIELNPEYAKMAQRRIEDDAGLFANVAAE